MSAERRLTIWSLPDSDEPPANNIENSDDVKSKMMKIINIAKDGNGLENLRKKSENIGLLQTFVSYCLIHFTTSINWRYNACNIVISEIFTESDEAMCILLIENHAEDYAKMHREQIKVSRKESRPKYTKVENSDKKFKGWDRRGIYRFNCIVAAVKKNRELSESKDMEMQLKSRYIELSGRENGGDDESDYDDCDLDELNGYDGFAGVTDTNSVSNENTTEGGGTLGATNITAV